MSISLERLQRDIEAIAAITATPGQGATRPTFSPEWGRARDYFISQAQAHGCHVRIDCYGNVHARLKSVPWDQRVWLCGSHIDTVPHGGDYDGVAGVVTGLELLRSAHEDGLRLPLEALIFAEEEGPTFGLGMIGARAWVGELDEKDLRKLKNAADQDYIEAGKPFGVDPSQFQAQRLYPHHYLGLIEVHIEQGPGMWRRDQRLAVVRSIAGRKQYRVTVIGEANHAGATSMADRNDALVGAAEMIVALEHAVKELATDTVLSVGKLNCFPNAVNVIPDKVEYTIDFRAPDDEVLRRGDQMIKAILGGVLQIRDKLKCQFAQTESIGASPMNPRLVEALAGGSGMGGLPVTISGALHDSAILASRIPTVMLFVPSRDGISHNPAEFSRVEDIAEAAKAVEKLVRRPLSPDVSAMTRDAFVSLAGRWYEHSPWVAERAWALRPFDSLQALHEVMSAVVRSASPEEQMALIQAHPDLVGRLAREGKLTRESNSEQAAAGLTALTDAEITAFETHNAAYRSKFGFPFIICARKNRKEAILAAFPERLGNTREQEIQTALAEIDKIAELRMRDAVWEISD